MSNTREFIDISQNAILSKLVRYLKIKKREAKLIQDFKEGHCLGFTTLALYSLWLYINQNENIDDKDQIDKSDHWPSVKSRFEKISAWNGDEEILNKDHNHLGQDMERMTHFIVNLQGCYDLANRSQLDINLSDTKGRNFVREYSLTLTLKAKDFTRPLQLYHSKNKQLKHTTLINELFIENRLIYIFSKSHIIGLIKYGKYFCLYDANAKKGFIFIKAKKGKAILAQHIFQKLFNHSNYQSQFGILILHHQNRKFHVYPRQKDLLNTIGRREIAVHNKLTNLYSAIDIDCYESIRFHLKNFPKNCDDVRTYINWPCKYQITALHEAASYGRRHHILMALLEMNANPNVRNQLNETPLFIAVKRQNLRGVILLLMKGADPNLCNNKQISPLHLAAETNNILLIKILLKFSASVNHCCLADNTPLHAATKNGHLKTVKILLKNKANPNALNHKNQTPLYLAAKHKKIKVAEYLIMLPRIRLSVIEKDMLRTLKSTLIDYFLTKNERSPISIGNYFSFWNRNEIQNCVYELAAGLSDQMNRLTS